VALNRTYFVLFAFLVGLAGCASLEERQALDTWRDVDEHLTAAVVETYDFPRQASLDELLVYAERSNPGLREQADRWKAALEKVPQAGALPEPRLSYGLFLQEVETRVGAQQWRIGLEQGFPWFGKLDLKERIALYAAMAQRENYEAERLALLYRVGQAYCEYHYLTRAAEIVDENVRLLEYLERVTRAKYESATGAHAAVIKSQVELGRLEDRLASLRDMTRPIAAKLNAELGRPADAPLAAPDALPDYTASPTSRTVDLRDTNPKLRAAALAIERERLAIRLAKKSYFPDFMVGLMHIETERADTGGMMPPQDDTGKDPLVATVGISLPIWHRKYRAAVREARARLDAAARRLDDMSNRLGADLEMARFGLREAQRKIDLYRDALLPKSEQSLNVTQQAYAAGSATFLDVVDAQRVMLEFQLSLERVLADRAQRHAELDMLVGRNP